MEHFIIAFWITTLFGCLQAGWIPSKDMGIYYMRKDIKCQSDSTFYAPANVKVECIASALDCIMKELNGTVTKECEDPYDRIGDAVEFLKEKQKEVHATKNSTKCQCEAWPETPLQDFLTKIEDLLQLENTVRGQ